MNIVSPNSIIEKPTFRSQRLSDAFDEVSDIFDLHQQDINAVSEDIKSLEAYIKSRNVSVTFSKVYEPNDVHCRYRLYWDKRDQSSKEFRLLCSIEQFNSEIEAWCQIEERPLIESPLSTRMAVYGYLPDFTKSLASAIKIFNRPKPEPVEPVFDEDEIPF